MSIDSTAPAGSTESRPVGSMSAAISKMIVQLVRDATGRGPTKVRTSIRENVVVVLLEDTLTKGEQTLVSAGRADKVLELRHEFQTAMKAKAITLLEGITGCGVVAMMSANHVEPDLSAEIFVLDRPPSSPGADG